jgi:hypothetical protein
MASTPTSIVQAWSEAVHKGEFDKARPLARENLHFRGPLDTFDHVDDFLAALKQLGGIVKGVEPEAVLARREPGRGLLHPQDRCRRRSRRGVVHGGGWEDQLSPRLFRREAVRAAERRANALSGGARAPAGRTRQPLLSIAGQRGQPVVSR